MTDEKKASMPAHEPGTTKGEETKSKKGAEPGRVETESKDANRPTGKSTGRMSSSVSPQDPIDPESPNLPPA